MDIEEKALLLAAGELQQRKTSEKEKRRKEIMEAARIVLLKCGYKKTTVIEIASVAKVSPGTLYLYFKSKDDLYAALSINTLKNMKKQIKKITQNESLSTEERILGLKKTLLTLYDYDERELLNLLYFQSSETLNRFSKEVVMQIKDIFDQFSCTIASTIRDEIKQETLCKENPMIVADIIWGIFFGIIFRFKSKSQLDFRKGFPKETLELAFKIFYQGIRVK